MSIETETKPGHAAPPDRECGRSGDATVAAGYRPALLRRVAWLEGITLAWMIVECGGSLLSAWQARSLALAAFGSDSLVELASAALVLAGGSRRLGITRRSQERAAAVLLFLLAAVVIVFVALGRHAQAETSLPGIVITSLALVGMPILAARKRRYALLLDNRALYADAAQSATCAWLAAVTLAGVAANALWQISWVDSTAALAAVPILALEGRRSWRGQGCACHR